MKPALSFVLFIYCNCLFGQNSSPAPKDSWRKDTTIYAYTLSVAMTPGDQLDSLYMLVTRHRAKHLRTGRYASTLYFVTAPGLDTMHAPMKRNAWPGLHSLGTSKGHKVILKGQVFRECLVNNFKPKATANQPPGSKPFTRSAFIIINKVIIN